MRERLRRLGVVGLCVATVPLACVPTYAVLSDAPDAAGTEAGASEAGAPVDSTAPMPDAALDAGVGVPDAPILVDNVDGGGCMIVTSSPTDLGVAHVDASTMITYSSEPGSSGPHYDEWAAFVEFGVAVPPGYYVHSLEHGAVAFVYRCPSNAGCSGVTDELRKAMAAIPNDPMCNVDAGVRARLLMMPDPYLDVPIAAVAWDHLYKANCIDLASLVQFAKDNYGKGPESRCDQGRYTF
jgi:hypothetical protein